MGIGAVSREQLNMNRPVCIRWISSPVRTRDYTGQLKVKSVTHSKSAFVSQEGISSPTVPGERMLIFFSQALRTSALVSEASSF